VPEKQEALQNAMACLSQRLMQK